MKKYKTLISLIVAVTLFVSSLSGVVAFADETVKIENENGELVDAIVDPETGDLIILESEEEEIVEDEEASEEDSEEATDEEVEQEQEDTNKLPEAKLSGVDFVHVYDGSFETVSDYLRKLGILKDTDTDPELTLTRGEFAVLVARILNENTGGKVSAFRYEFKDVDETLSCYNAVNTLCNYGFIQGDGNGYFYPDNEIKSAEAVIILMNMLGYYEVAQLRGSGDNGYRNLAVNMKFTKEVPFNYSTTVTLEKAARLIYHALHEKVVESSAYSGLGVTFSQSDDTLMCRYLDVYTIEGVVTANEYTSLSSKAGKTSENTIKIAGTIVNFEDENLNPQDYLGLYSRVYYKDEAGKKSAIYVEAIEEKYDTLKINAKNIVSFDRTTKILTYKDGKKVRQEKVDMDISIIFNSAAVGGNIHENYFTPDVGQLVFIDNNRDKKFDVLVIDSFSAYVSKGKISDAEGTLYDELGAHAPLSLADKDVRVYKNNEKADYSAIASGDVVFVATEKVCYEVTESISPIEYQTIDATSEYVKLLASDYKISGTIDSIDDEYVYIDSAAYVYSNEFYIAANIGESSKAINSTRLNVKISGRLDLNGDIVWLSRNADTNLKYAYVVKAGVGDKASANHRIMMYTQDNEMVIVEFADKVKVYNQWVSGAINSNTYYDKTFKGNTITAEFSEIGLRQLVKYKMNEDGQVTEIYISADDTARDYYKDIPTLQEGIFYYSTEVKSNTTDYLYYMSFGNNGIIEPFFLYSKNNSVGFVVPKGDSAAATLEDERYYSAYTVTSKGAPMSHAENLTLAVKLYDVDNGVVGAVLREKTYSVSTSNTGVSFSYSSTFVDAVVDSVRQVRDEETGGFVTEISAWHKGKLTKYKLANSELVSHTVAFDSNLSNISPSDLRKGDVVMLHQDALGAVDGFKVAHRPMFMLENATEDAPFEGYEYTFSGTAQQASYAKYHIYLGTGVFAAGKVVKMAGSAPIVDTNQAAFRRMQMFGSASSVQILIYDVLQDTIKTSVTTSKNPTFANCEEGDYIFWYQYERYPETVIVIRNYR